MYGRCGWRNGELANLSGERGEQSARLAQLFSHTLDAGSELDIVPAKRGEPGGKCQGA
jgi:hypothetical protein